VPTLSELLSDPVLRGARPIAGQEHVAHRRVRWFSVVEWPAGHFVQEGDVVMTTGAGCDRDQFTEFMHGVLDNRPAVVLFCPPERSAVARMPAQVARLAERNQIPILQIPWEVRFADIARAVVRLVHEPASTTTTATDSLSPAFVAALLAETGVAAIVATAEEAADSPVVVFAADLRVEHAGPRAAQQLEAALRRSAAAVEELSASEILALRNALERGDEQDEAFDRIGLPPGTLLAAQSAHPMMGYVYSPLPHGGAAALSVLRQAAQALAVEQIRARAIAEADVRARGDLLWSIARGDVTDAGDIARRAALVGHSPSDRYCVAVGLPSPGSAGSNDEVMLDAVTIPRLRRRGINASRSLEGVLLLARMSNAALFQLLRDAPGATWGIADHAVTLADLRDAFLRARDTAAAAIAIGAKDSANHEADFGPYLLLARIADDEAVTRAIGSLLDDVLEYDRRTSRDLLQTLDVYLAENGNTSSAARVLHLNRHSLMYRIQKIEAFTGRDLANHEDRFLLDLALHLHKLRSSAAMTAGVTRPDARRRSARLA
jgi:purine catabolism regulator